MVSTPNVSYQPAVALQGEPHVENNTIRQEPKTNQTQPKQAAAADTQTDRNSLKREKYQEESTEVTQDSKSSFKDENRGSKLDIAV